MAGILDFFGNGQAWNRASQLLTDREGRQNIVYPDSQGKMTVGIGHKVLPGDMLSFGDVIPDDQVDQFFQGDLSNAMASAQQQATDAAISDPDFIGNLAAVNFQLGSGWTSRFPQAWQMIINGDYDGAADAVAQSSDATGPSKWYSQSPLRVQDFQDALHALSAQGNTANETSPSQ